LWVVRVRVKVGVRSRKKRDENAVDEAPDYTEREKLRLADDEVEDARGLEKE
jgi:hypothetical protein